MATVDNNIGIYKITNPFGKIYIGQSRDIKRRFDHYRWLHCKGQRKLYRSLKKYGVNSHKFEVIVSCEIDELNKLERFYQDFYNCCDRNVGLNCVLTKTDLLPVFVSKETRDRKRVSMTGKTWPEESKLRVRAMHRKWNHSNEAKLKIGIFHKGRIVSDETKLKCSKNSSHNRNVINIDTMQIWNSASLCSKEYGFNSGSFCNKLSGFCKNTTSFRWLDSLTNN